MSGDKRPVMTDALETLGTLIDDTAGRDAIHIAVEPVVAAISLYPGQDIGLTADGARPVGDGVKGIGVVDPFLSGVVYPGQRFWLLVYPRTITSLRHVWEHPGFDNDAVPFDRKVASEQWLRDFCERSDCPSYESVIGAAIDNRGGSYGDFEYLHFSGIDAHGDIPPEFWDHVEIVTGQTVPSDERGTYFSCSC